MHVLNNCYFIFFFLPGGVRDNDHNDLDFLNDEEKKKKEAEIKNPGKILIARMYRYYFLIHSNVRFNNTL